MHLGHPRGNPIASRASTTTYLHGAAKEGKHEDMRNEKERRRCKLRVDDADRRASLETLLPSARVGGWALRQWGAVGSGATAWLRLRADETRVWRDWIDDALLQPIVKRCREGAEAET